jgi:hypothetical protein
VSTAVGESVRVESGSGATLARLSGDGRMSGDPKRVNGTSIKLAVGVDRPLVGVPGDGVPVRVRTINESSLRMLEAPKCGFLNRRKPTPVSCRPRVNVSGSKILLSSGDGADRTSGDRTRMAVILLRGEIWGDRTREATRAFQNTDAALTAESLYVICSAAKPFEPRTSLRNPAAPG